MLPLSLKMLMILPHIFTFCAKVVFVARKKSGWRNSSDDLSLLVNVRLFF